MSASTWNGFVIAPTQNLATDEELDEYIQQTAAFACHPVGTAAMSASDSGWGVVNPDLKVKGVAKLRIVDASIMVGGFLLVKVTAGTNGT